MTDIKIGWDAQHAKFTLKSPMWANDLIRSMGAVRWSKAQKAWLAAPVKANIEYMKKHIDAGYMEADDEAKKQIAKGEKAVKALRPPRGEGFPHWYKYKAEPRPFQIEGLNKFYPLNVFAAHADRGTGKSKLVVDLSCAWRMEAKIDCVLIVCRLSLRENWRGWDEGTEIGQREGYVGFAPIPVSIHLPLTEREREFDRWLGNGHDFQVMIVGIESLSAGGMVKIAERFLTAHSKPLMVIDEAHDISNHKAIRTENCYMLGNLATKRGTLTGSPVRTGPMNLFSQYEFLDTNVIGLGDYYAFRGRYAIMGGYRDPKTGRPLQVVGYQNLEELANLVAPFTWEVRKKDVLSHLPPKSYEKRIVQLTDAQVKLYRQIKKEKEYEWKGKSMVTKNVLELALRLHQVVGGWITTAEEVETRPGKIKRIPTWHPVIPPAKNPKIQEVLAIAEDDCQQIIWAAYRPEIAAIVEVLSNKYPKEKVREFHGGVSTADRETFKREFQAGKAKFLVGNMATGGVGHTLTACETMVYFNNTEQMIDREQSEDRAHRDGLTHPVLYIDIVAENTVDVLIMESIKNKMDLSEYIRQRIRDASRLLGDV